MKVLFLYMWLFYKDSPWPTLKDNMTVIPRCDVLRGTLLGSAGFYEEGNRDTSVTRHIADTEFGIRKKVCMGRRKGIKPIWLLCLSSSSNFRPH